MLYDFEKVFRDTNPDFYNNNRHTHAHKVIIKDIDNYDITWMDRYTNATLKDLGIESTDEVQQYLHDFWALDLASSIEGIDNIDKLYEPSESGDGLDDSRRYFKSLSFYDQSLSDYIKNIDVKTFSDWYDYETKRNKKAYKSKK